MDRPRPADFVGSARWDGVVAVEGVHSEDGRLIAPGALYWDRHATLPVVVDDAGDEQVGVVRELSRLGALIIARGLVDSGLRLPRGLGVEVTPGRDVQTPSGGLTLLKAKVVAVLLMPEEDVLWRPCQMLVETPARR